MAQMAGRSIYQIDDQHPPHHVELFQGLLEMRIRQNLRTDTLLPLQNTTIRKHLPMSLPAKTVAPATKLAKAEVNKPWAKHLTSPAQLTYALMFEHIEHFPLYNHPAKVG